MKKGGWRGLLTEHELHHLIMAGCYDFQAVTKTALENLELHQKWLHDDNASIFHGCWTCVGIGRKLGMGG